MFGNIELFAATAGADRQERQRSLAIGRKKLSLAVVGST